MCLQVCGSIPACEKKAQCNLATEWHHRRQYLIICSFFWSHKRFHAILFCLFVFFYICSSTAQTFQHMVWNWWSYPLRNLYSDIVFAWRIVLSENLGLLVVYWLPRWHLLLSCVVCSVLLIGSWRWRITCTESGMNRWSKWLQKLVFVQVPHGGVIKPRVEYSLGDLNCRHRQINRWHADFNWTSQTLVDRERWKYDQISCWHCSFSN